MLAWTLILTVAGGLIIGGFLVYAATSLITTSGSSEQVRVYYTADAGAEACLVALSQGQNTCPATLSLNGYTAAITTTGPLTNVAPSAPRYLVTGLEGRALGPGEARVLELNSRPITIQVNWPFAPSPLPGTWDRWELRLYKGANPVLTDPSSLVMTATGIWSPAQLQAPASIVTDGVHTLIFLNNTATTTITTALFSANGSVSNTWVWANAYRDYIITSTVGNTILEIVARQTPGTSLITNPITVTVASWLFR